MKILIKNGHVIDPDTKLDQVADVLLEDDKIQEVKENIKDKADIFIRSCSTAQRAAFCASVSPSSMSL